MRKHKTIEIYKIKKCGNNKLLLCYKQHKNERELLPRTTDFLPLVVYAPAEMHMLHFNTAVMAPIS